MLKSRSVKRIGTVAGALTSALLLTVTQASAAAKTERATATDGGSKNGKWECNAYYVGDWMQARVCFDQDGDWFEIYDAPGADGYSAVADWEIHNRWGGIFNADGAGSTRFKNKDFPEGYKLRYRACLGNWSTKTIVARKCSAWETVDNN
ncbi:hypothetical protein ACFQ7I_07120 [Streptomyces massasporeus]